MATLKEVGIDLLKFGLEFIKGLGILFLGVLMTVYPKTLQNPTPETINLWQGMGGSVALVGLTTMVTSGWRIGKTKEEKRHDEIIKELKAVRSQLTELKGSLTTNEQPLKETLPPNGNNS